mmetsp:Transcript_6755/g.25246  ORF Transcript_6755/g.25246 Transcript_6755/m.25246 type:complete len:276 (+) Transcript_6755:1642-2469(+)
MCPGDGNMHKCMGIQYADTEALIECKECTQGSYTDNIHCFPCNEADGEFCPDATTRIVCEAWEYFDTITTTCIDCPTDHVCMRGRKYECPPGFYVSHTSPAAPSHCLECPVGWICPGNGVRYQCINENYNPFPGQTECLVCGTGFFTNNSSTSCLACPQNTHCGDGIVQLVCDPGYYLTSNDDSSLRECVACPRGFYCQDFQRTSCATGYYANATGSSECIPCPLGTMQHSIVQASETIDDCVLCPEGHYSDQTASTVCKPCPRGTWSSVIGASM